MAIIGKLLCRTRVTRTAFSFYDLPDPMDNYAECSKKYNVYDDGLDHGIKMERVG